MAVCSMGVYMPGCGDGEMTIHRCMDAGCTGVGCMRVRLKAVEGGVTVMLGFKARIGIWHDVDQVTMATQINSKNLELVQELFLRGKFSRREVVCGTRISGDVNLALTSLRYMLLHQSS